MLQIGIYPLHLRMQSSHLPPRLLLDSSRTRAIPFLPAYVPTSATYPRSRCTTRHVSAAPHGVDLAAKSHQTMTISAVDHGWESSPLQGPGPQSDGRTVLIWRREQLHSSANDQIVS